MSLINTVRRPGHVLMISDGIGLGDDCRVASIAPKVVLLPLLNAVIGMRGNAMITTLLMAALAADWQKFRTYDGFKAGLVDHLRAIFSVVGSQWQQLQGADCLEMDVIVAGWSETSGPDSYLLRTVEGTPTPAWQIIDTGDVLLTPSNDEIFKADGGSLADQSRAISDAELIAVAEKQRRYVESYGPNKIESSMVGGFLQSTKITEREISTRILHWWPDEIGEPILVTPTAGEAA
jgi:hypothetical protein